MKMTSVCSTSAAALAIAIWMLGERKRARWFQMLTIGDAKRCARAGEIITELVVHEAECNDKHVEEDPGKEK